MVNVGLRKPPLTLHFTTGQFAAIGQPRNLIGRQVQVRCQPLNVKIVFRHVTKVSQRQRI
jgi:hypothetical protein